MEKHSLDIDQDEVAFSTDNGTPIAEVWIDQTDDGFVVRVVVQHVDVTVDEINSAL